MKRRDTMCLEGMGGRVPLVTGLKLFPVLEAVFRLESVVGRGGVPLTLGFTMCLMGRGGESVVSFLPTVVMGDPAM